MNDSNQRNNGSDPLSSNVQSVDVDLDSSLTGVHSLHTKPEETKENSYQSFMVNQTISVPEQKDGQPLGNQSVTEFGSFSVDQNNNIEQIEVNSNERMNPNSEVILKNDEANDIASAGIVQSVGHVLRNARMARGMSIDDVSRQLRLSVQQIEAIEKGDFEKLPGRTFLRGFVRNYANLCQLSPAPLLQMLPESMPVQSNYERTPIKNKQLSFAGRRENSNNSRVGLIIILFAIVLGAYFFYENSSWKKLEGNDSHGDVKSGSEKASVEIQLPLSSTRSHTQINKIPETNIQLPNQKNLDATSNLNIQTLTLPIENKPVIQETEKPIPTLSDMGALHFKFNADSWVKVIDGKNVTILEQVRKGGSEQIITGKRPLSVVIGNAAGVNLTYNDKEIDMSLYKKQDGTARLTLE